MGVVVDDNLESMRRVLLTGDEELAAQAVSAADRIDAMNVSLTERCYELLRREAPVAAGQALDRISDHAAILGARIRYLITGDPSHLAAEVR